MTRSLVFAVVIFFSMLSQSVPAVIVGSNDYRPADNRDIASDYSLDREIKSLIQRVVQVKTPYGFYGSAFVFGS